MATLKIVPKEHWEILRKYLCDDDGESPVLLPEDNLKKFSEENAAILREHDGKYIEYDFGGEPDVVLDIIRTPDCYAGRAIMAPLAGEEDEL